MQRAAAAEGHEGKRFGSKPRSMLTSRIAPAMRELATVRMASAASVVVSPSFAPTWVSMARAAASTSSRESLPPMGLSGSIRPSTTLASVTVGRSLP
jgi:hypothetical protein